MQGIRLSERFYRQVGEPMLREKFPADWPRFAAGLVGHGSECYGYDDELSRDHDYGPEFCLFLSPTDEAALGKRLREALAALPSDFEGVSRSRESAKGGGTHGVWSIPEFYRGYTGRPGAPETWQDWLLTPSASLAEACNGAVFFDGSGEFSAVRRVILGGMPEDVRKKRLAARLAFMAQTGQYNYARCRRRGETGAAAWALGDFVRNAAEAIFLLNRRYMPYYKWAFRAMRDLPCLAELTPPLEFLLTEGEDGKTAAVKEAVTEDVCGAVIGELRRQGLTGASGNYLEPHAFSVMEGIGSPEIRRLHVMTG